MICDDCGVLQKCSHEDTFSTHNNQILCHVCKVHLYLKRNEDNC